MKDKAQMANGPLYSATETTPLQHNTVLTLSSGFKESTK